jgi:hypothetical protein
MFLIQLLGLVRLILSNKGTGDVSFQHSAPRLEHLGQMYAAPLASSET